MNNEISNNIKLITLIGMMGSGKTTCGSFLAKKLEISFIDIDSIIELEENLKISKIFNKFGEKYFRLIEEKVVFLLNFRITGSHSTANVRYATS